MIRLTEQYKAWAPIFAKKHIDEEAAQQFVQQHVKQECFAEIIPVDLHHIENILEKINDDQSRIIANAERKILKILEGDCDTAIGVYAKIDKDFVNIKAELFSVDGKHRYFIKETKEIKLAKELGREVGEKLKSQSKGSYKR